MELTSAACWHEIADDGTIAADVEPSAAAVVVEGCLHGDSVPAPGMHVQGAPLTTHAPPMAEGQLSAGCVGFVHMLAETSASPDHRNETVKTTIALK